MEHIVQPGDRQSTAIGSIDITSQLGKGSYGIVFKGTWYRGDRQVALKVEKPTIRPASFSGPYVPRHFTEIEHEWKMMVMMNETRGFPLVYTRNFRAKYKYYVMQLVGQSLNSLRNSMPGRRIKTRTLIPIGLQMLTRLETLHAMGYLMYDIHLGNFLISQQTVYAIDLGMAYRYINNGVHIPDTRSFIPHDYKNHYFAALRDSEGLMVARRDEMERWLYVVVKMALGRLPWEGIKGRTAISNVKRKASIDDICRGKARWLAPAMAHVWGLSFAQEPDYDYIRTIFNTRLQELDANRNTDIF